LKKRSGKGRPVPHDPKEKDESDVKTRRGVGRWGNGQRGG